MNKKNNESIIIKMKRATVEGVLLNKIYLGIKSRLMRPIIKLFIGEYRKIFFSYFDKKISSFAIRRLAKTLPIDENKIVFVTSRGSYNCNPRFIADEVIKRKLPYKLVWVIRKENLKHSHQYPKELKLVLRDSYEFYQEIDNSINLYYMGFVKRPQQILIETWHGSLGIKRFETTDDKKWVRFAEKCGVETDYIISNSSFEDELFNKYFWTNAKNKRFGHARNDILIGKGAEWEEKREKIIHEVRERFHIDEDIKVALYAPTFRENTELFEPYNINYMRLAKSLKKRFGGKWIIISRLHFTMRKKAKKYIENHLSCVIDGSDYSDIQDLMLVADVGITDYSSWIYDYILTGKPGFIYAVDLREYYSERGFYYSLDTTPFQIAESDYELEKNILNYDETSYQEKRKAFICEKGCMEDGYASERIVNMIMEITAGRQAGTP